MFGVTSGSQIIGWNRTHCCMVNSPSLPKETEAEARQQDQRLVAEEVQWFALSYQTTSPGRWLYFKRVRFPLVLVHSSMIAALFCVTAIRCLSLPQLGLCSAAAAHSLSSQNCLVITQTIKEKTFPSANLYFSSCAKHRLLESIYKLERGREKERDNENSVENIT